MNAELLETLGKIAGIGGIALGVGLIVFREVIRKSVLGALSKDDAYRLVRLVAVFSWTIALAGMGAWAWVETSSNNDLRTDDPSIATEGAQSPVVTGTGGNVQINIGTGSEEKKE